MGELGDLLELLYGAHERYRTVRLTIRTWEHLERSRTAFERAREPSGRRGIFLRLTGGAPGREPRPETAEYVSRFWLDGDRIREEVEDGLHARTVVRVGGTWWLVSPDRRPLTNEGDPDHQAGAGDEARSLLDPAALLGCIDLAPAGRREVAGRRGLVARGVPRGVEPLSPLLWQLLEAEEIELVVDAERGILLRIELLIDGEPFRIVDVVEVAFDETFPEATFTIELPPGRSWSRAGARRQEHVTLTAAARRAPFRLFVPGRLGKGWQFEHAVHFRASEHPDVPESVTLVYTHPLGPHHFSLHEATRPHPWLGSEALRTVEQDGLVMKTIEPDEADAPMPRHVLVERDGTHVNVHSQQLPLEELIEIAASLVPEPDSPPPAVER